MNCRQAEHLWDAYLDGELSDQLRLELEAHRVRCQRCQQALALMEAAGHVIAEQPRSSLNDDFTNQILSESQAYRPATKRRISAVSSVSWAAAAIVAIVITLMYAPISRDSEQAVESVEPRRLVSILEESQFLSDDPIQKSWLRHVVKSDATAMTCVWALVSPPDESI